MEQASLPVLQTIGQAGCLSYKKQTTDYVLLTFPQNSARKHRATKHSRSQPRHKPNR